MGVILKFETRTELETVNCMDSMLGLGTFLFVCLFIFLFVKGTTVHYLSLIHISEPTRR